MISISKQDKKEIRITTFFMLIFSLITYAIFFSTLVLFMTNGLKLNDVKAASITATFLAFHFSLQLLGGFFTGRFFSHRTLLSIGFILQSFGCIILSYFKLFWGLAFFLSGTGFNIVCINCLLTQFYKPKDKTRERAFIINYTAMNIGAIIGTSISGIFEIYQKYNLLFIFGAIINFIPLIIVLLKWKLFKDRNTYYSLLSTNKKRNFNLLGITLIGLLILALRWVVFNSYYSNKIILFIGTIMIFFVIFLVIKNQDLIQKKLLVYLIFILTNLIFWTLNLMSPMGLILFIENNVNRNILNIMIPPQWTINIVSLTIIIAGPILVSLFKFLRQKGYNITITNQFISALFSIGIGFLILPIGIKFADIAGYVNLLFVIVSYIFIGLGEILFAPIGYAMIGQIIPHKLQNLMMGIWIMIIGAGAAMANIFSKIAIGITTSENPLKTNPHFFKSFISLAMIALIAAIILYLFSKVLNRIVKDHKTI